EALEGVIGSGSAIISNYAEAEDKEAIKTGTTVAQSIRQLALEFFPERYSIGTRQGFLVARQVYDTLPLSARRYFWAPPADVAAGQSLPKRTDSSPLELWMDRKTN